MTLKQNIEYRILARISHSIKRLDLFIV